MSRETPHVSDEVHDIREHKKWLDDRLRYIQLEFAERQMKKEPPLEEKFSEIIWSITPLGKEIANRLHQRWREAGKKGAIPQEELEKEITFRRIKIDEIYQQHLPDWMEQVMALTAL